MRREMERRTQEAALIIAVSGGQSIALAAKTVGMGRTRAIATLAHYKVKVPAGGHRRRGEPALQNGSKFAGVDLAELADGLSTRAVASILGIHWTRVAAELRRIGIVRARGRPREIDVAQVKEMRACGYSYQDIAEVLGASRRGVSTAFNDGRSTARRIDAAAVADLRDGHGFGWDDIGRHLDCHPDTAKKLYYRTKKPGACEQAPAEHATGKPDDQMFAGSLGGSEHIALSLPSR